MNEQQTNDLPQPKNTKQIRSEELRPYWLDPREDYPEPYYMLE